jgi:hypothetical protein
VRRALVPSGFELLERERAADAHFHFMGFKTFYQPAAARLYAGAEALYIAHAIGANVLKALSLGLYGNQKT